ncbi:MAG: hypothetical protein R3F05_17670 [Planctomycetota bacterium]|nr:hypothetical protein [Planctomycetota bacterium]MCB9900874.1 hypothetical protein [Planctomycetota bacterium]
MTPFRLRHACALALGLAGLVAATSGPARADVLELSDGRLVEGRVVKSGDELLVLSRFGVSSVAASDVVARHEGVSADAQVKSVLAKLAPDDFGNRVRVATWLKALGREDEARALAEEVLAADPEQADAHGLLGHVRFRGQWMHPDEARRAEGLERHGERWYTPEEWANVGAEERNAAALVDEREQRTKTVREAQRLMNLMTSPDRSVRQRARTRLERLAKESGNETIEKLVPRMDEYVQAVDEAQARAAELGDSMMVGEVMSTFRVTLARLKRPIQQITTNLASGPFPSAPVTLQLPELEVIRVRTTGVIPVVGP